MSRMAQKGGSMTFNLSYAPFDVDKFLNDTLEAANRSSAWNPACNTYEDEQGFWVQWRCRV